MVTFEEGLHHIHCPTEKLPVTAGHAKKYDRSITSINNGRPQVDKGSSRGFEDSYEFWRGQNIDLQKLSAVVDDISRWIYIKDLHELEDKLLHGTREDFVAYMRSIYSDLEILIQPTLNSTAKYPSHGFNGHTWISHIEGLIGGIHHLSDDLNLSDMEYKLVVFEIFAHDIGNALGRGAHAPNSIGLLMLIYGKEIFDVQELRPALRGVLFHDEPIIMPTVNLITYIVECECAGLSQEKKSERFMELYAEFSSKIESLLRLLDKGDSRRARVNNDIDLSSQALEDDPHFRSNIVWEIDPTNTGVRHDGEEKIFKIQYLFNMEPDEVVAPLGSSLIIQPKHLPAELRMPEVIHNAFKRNKKIGYFDLITEEHVHIYHERIGLIVLDAFRVFPDIDKVEIKFHDPKEYQPKIGMSRQRRKNEDISLTFLRSNMLLAIEVFEDSVLRRLNVRQIDQTLDNLSQGVVLPARDSEI